MPRRAAGSEARPPRSPRRRTKPRAKRASPCSRENPLGSPEGPVPQTDTGGWVEHTEAIGRTMVKELGKITPQLREKGRRPGWRGEPPEPGPASGDRSKRLFTKNTGLC